MAIGKFTAAPVPGTRAVRALVCVMFFLFAMTTDAVGSVITTVIREMHLSMTAASSFHYAPMISMALGGLLLGFLADSWGRRLAILAGLILYGVGSALFATGTTLPYFVALLSMSGLGISIFKVGGLALIGDVSATPTQHKQLMNTAEGCFAVGSIVGPAIVAVLLEVNFSWRWLYVIASVMCFALVAVASRVRFPAARSSRVERPSVAYTLRVLRTPHVLPTAALIMLYVGVEVAVYVWMPTYLQQYRGAVRWLPLYALTLFFVLRAVGRFVGVWLLGRYSVRMVLALSSLAVLACILGATVGGASVAAYALPLSGLPMSVIYPTLNSEGISQFPPDNQGAAAGVLLFFTALAAALGPLAMAAVSDLLGDARFGFLLASAFALAMTVGLLVSWLRAGSAAELARSS